MTIGNSTLIPAPFWRRFFAYSTDLTIVSFFLFLGLVLIGLVAAIVLVVAGLGAGVMAKDASGPGLIAVLIFVLVALAGMIVLAIIYHGYFVHFESKDGMTPGKRIFGLAVKTMDGAVPSSTQCLVRDVLRYIDCVLIVPGLLAFMFSTQKRRIGDFVANTMVVYEPMRAAATHRLYLTQGAFQELKKSLTPKEIPSSVAKQYLTFAFPRFISHEPISTASDEEWKRSILPYINPGPATALPDEMIFRFFAECCAEKLREA